MSTGDSRPESRARLGGMTPCMRLYLGHQSAFYAYLTRLREACELAVSKGYGIFTALWEEPAPRAG
jgi:hypothetical protein